MIAVSPNSLNQPVSAVEKHTRSVVSQFSESMTTPALAPSNNNIIIINRTVFCLFVCFVNAPGALYTGMPTQTSAGNSMARAARSHKPA